MRSRIQRDDALHPRVRSRRETRKKIRLTKCCHSKARSPAETLVWLEQNSKILMKPGFRYYWHRGAQKVDDRTPRAITSACLEARYDG